MGFLFAGSLAGSGRGGTSSFSTMASADSMAPVLLPVVVARFRPSPPYSRTR